MKPIVVCTFLVLAAILVGCEKQHAARGPVPFDITGLQTGPDALNTNALKITGTVRVRDDALRDKAILLRIGGTVSFKHSGVTKPVFAPNDQVLVTNGTGMLELWFYATPAEKRTIEAELPAPSYSFESPGYTELKPTSLEIR
jgi:hypothetical protein